MDYTRLIVSGLAGVLISSSVLITNLFNVQGQQQPMIAGFIPIPGPEQRQQQQERVRSQAVATSNSSVEEAASATTSAHIHSNELSVSASVINNTTVGKTERVTATVVDSNNNPVVGALVTIKIEDPIDVGIMKGMLMGAEHVVRVPTNSFGQATLTMKVPTMMKNVRSGTFNVQITTSAPGYNPIPNPLFTSFFACSKRGC